MFYIKPQDSIKNCCVIIGENTDFESHFHENLELIYIKSGSRKMLIDNKEYILNGNDFAVIFPCQTHSLKSLKGGSCAFLGINPFFLEDLKSDLLNKIPKIPVIKKSDQSDKLKSLLKTLFSNNENNSLYIKGLAISILSLVFDDLDLKERANNLIPYLPEIIRFISENKNNPDFNAEEVSKHFGVTERKLCEWFNSAFNMGFRKFLNRYRLNDAVILLSDSDLTISEICYNCGFESARTFNRIFLNEYNCSPTTYRKNVRKTIIK